MSNKTKACYNLLEIIEKQDAKKSICIKKHA